MYVWRGCSVMYLNLIYVYLVTFWDARLVLELIQFPRILENVPFGSRGRGMMKLTCDKWKVNIFIAHLLRGTYAWQIHLLTRDINECRKAWHGCIKWDKDILATNLLTFINLDNRHLVINLLTLFFTHTQ